jgi:hypothetical protein
MVSMTHSSHPSFKNFRSSQFQNFNPVYVNGYVRLLNSDGKERVAKEIVEAIDEANKLVKFKVIEGDLMELYKTFYLTVHVETKGENNLVTWTLEYEKLKESVPDPHTLMEFCRHVTKDIETHHLK